MGVAQKMIGRVIAVVALAILTHVRSPGLAHAVDPKPMAAGVSEKSSSATAGREKVMTYKPGEKTKGYTCVFMGHSFFYRIAHGFEKVAIGSGFTEHKQVVRVAHGKEGTPGWLWDHVGPKEESRRLLQDEKVDLLAISYHGRSADRCRVEDYSRWIDFARQKNPDIMVAVGLSWTGLYVDTPEEYAALYRKAAAPVYPLIDALREKYPQNAIFVIPHGQGVVELYAQYHAGKVSEIKTLLPPGKDPFFLDTTYHAGPMAQAVTRLVFLATIYETDPRQSAWSSGFQADLKQIAYDAVKDEPYARLVKGKQPATAETAPAKKE
jgi:hypothetical protein